MGGGELSVGGFHHYTFRKRRKYQCNALKISQVILRILMFLAVVVLFHFGSRADAQQSLKAADSQPREINITSDSAAGWLPSDTLEKTVVTAVTGYFESLDGEDYSGAYEKMAAANKKYLPYSKFLEQSQRFHSVAGQALQRLILKITWTKDPPGAPFPGVFAAVDIAGKFENIDRECGFVVFYQAPEDMDFELMRIESNFIDNATALNIEQTQSGAALDALWLSLSANCPNYSAVSSD